MNEADPAPPTEQEFSFLYANGGLYMVLLLVFFLAWLGFLTLGEALLYRAVATPPHWLAPAAFLTGLVAGYYILRGPLRFLHLFRGTGTLRGEGFDIRLRFSRYTVPFSRVRRVFYKESGTGRGFMLSAKGASLFIGEAGDSRGGEQPHMLYEFYRAVERGLAAYRRQTTA